MTARAAIYCRVSTTKQVDKYSLPTQEAMLRTYAEEHGMEVIEPPYIEKGKSAKNLDRPELQRLLSDVQAGKVDAILCLESDRFTRSVRDMLELHQFLHAHQCELIATLEPRSDMTTSDGIFTQTIRTAMNERERRHTGERTRRTMENRAKQGKFNGGRPPFGYMTQRAYETLLTQAGNAEADAQQEAARRFPERGKLYVYEEEAQHISRIFQTYQETSSIRKVMLALNSQGIRTRKRARFSPTTVRDILRCPVYVGRLVWGQRTTDPLSHETIPQDKAQWIRADGQHAPLVSQETFDQVQELLTERTFKPTKPARISLLSGLVWCGLCGSHYNVNSTLKPDGRRYTYYKCVKRSDFGASTCDSPHWRAETLEQLVIDHLAALSQDTQFLTSKEDLLTAYQSQIDAGRPAQVTSELDRQIQAYERQIDAVLDALIQAEFQGDPRLKAKYATLKGEVDTLKQQRERLTRDSQAQWTDFEALKDSLETLQHFGERWEELDDQPRREFLRGIVDSITITGRTDGEIAEIHLKTDNVGLLLDTSVPWRHRTHAGPGS